MKKLTKKSLDELAMTMNVIPESEQDNYWGMYSNDCFWRCVSYVNSAGNSYSESDAASYATNYFASQYSGSDVENIAQATSYLAQSGAGMTSAQMSSYGNSNGNSSSTGQYVVNFSVNDFSNDYERTGTTHAVVITSTNSDGSLNAFDPQNNFSFTISASDVNKTNRVY